MPFIQIYLLEGRDEGKKRAIIEKVTTAVQESVGTSRENIHVAIVELPNTNLGTGGKSVKDLGR